MTPLVAGLLAVFAAGVPWTRDYGRALTRAEEERRPILFFFREECGGGSRPQNPIEAGGPIVHQEGLSDCDLMQQDVWESPPIVQAAARFVSVLVDGGDRTLQVRYQAVRMPTTLVTDPWGNEVLRASGYLPREKVAQILQATPKDFAPLEAAGRVLRESGTDFQALVAAARFYESAGMPQVADRHYARALAAPGAADVVARRQATISRGLLLMSALGQAGEAAALFEKELAADGPGTDALLLGLVNARLSQGRRKDAQAVVKQMEARFAGSPYTARARQNLAAAR